MIYEPGQEPEELRKHLSLLMKELREAYPDGLIVADMWKHDRWDNLLGHLVKQLGYPDSVSFLKAYGFEVFGDLSAQSQVITRSQPVVETPKKSASTVEQKLMYNAWYALRVGSRSKSLNHNKPPLISRLLQ